MLIRIRILMWSPAVSVSAQAAEFGRRLWRVPRADSIRQAKAKRPNPTSRLPSGRPVAVSWLLRNGFRSQDSRAA